MSLKFLTGFVPVGLLSLSLWQFSKSPPASHSSVEATTAASPAPASLETAVAGSYVAFDTSHTFVLPAGPRGLEYSPEIRALDGQKVRLSGSMVRHLHDDPAVFLLTEQPMTLNMAEYGLADDLPAQAVHVKLPVIPGMAPDWIRQPIMVYGRLELGPREEQDGRISQVRLFADHITAADGRTLLEPRRSVLLQPARIRSGRLPLTTISAR